MMDCEVKVLAEEVIRILSSKGKTVAVAESFTGGSVCSALVSVPGASSVLIDGVVAYSHKAKSVRLGIPSEVIEKHGAVSEITARAMTGAMLGSEIKPDYAIATTGNAGPGAEEKSEVGEAYIAIASIEKTIVFKLNLTGERFENIKSGVVFALEKFIKFVKN